MTSTKRLLFPSSITAGIRRSETHGAVLPSILCLTSNTTLLALRWNSTTSLGTGPMATTPTHAQRASSGFDGRSSASTVIVDPVRATKERDRMAREMLSRNMPCPAAEERVVATLKGLVHTVPYTLHIVEDGASLAKESEAKAKVILQECFETVDRHLNHFNPESEVSKVNELPVGETHNMSEHLARVMGCSVHVYNSSGTCLDPATGPLTKRLRELILSDEETDLILTEGEIERFSLPHSFDVDLTKGTISRLHQEAKLDLGSLNKGYTIDCVVEKLNEAGIANVLFEWGGDCRASGLNYKRNPWAIAITRPPSVCEVKERAEALHDGKEVEEVEKLRERAPLLRVMYLDDEALCTSGDYENVVFSKRNGVRSSLFDWKKRGLLEPADDELAQVSVRCYSAMYADALATASVIKRDTVKVRYMLEVWRNSRNRVTNYIAYTREGERLAHMYEIARETPELRLERIAGSLPARVIVVGGGLAGQSAAIEAASCGAQVILMEKESRLGGNSAKATSGINGWGTRAQALKDIQDNCKNFERDTYLSGLGGMCAPGLVRALSVKSSDAIGWLSSLGIPLTVLSQLGGHSRKRTHRAPDMSDGTPVPIGYTIMQTLERHIRNNLSDHITIMENTSVNALLHATKSTPDGGREVRVTGVSYIQLGSEVEEHMTLTADSVILATGGFSNDNGGHSLLRKYAPHLFGTPTTNGPFATGDGVKLARELGVTLVDMDKVQLHPTGLIDPKDPANPTKYLGPEALRGSGGILLNKKGERFVNELDLRSVVSKAINMQGDEYPGSNGIHFAYCVLNEAAVNLFGVSSLGFYWKKLGLFVKVDTVEELAALIECPKETLRSTLVEYEETSKASRICPRTRKSVYPCVLGAQGPYYVAFVTPSIHYTMGGCLISPAAEMLQEHYSMNILEDQRPIRGLFGAGEVTGGVHGGNRLGGNSLLECVVFGKIAGDRAATILQKRDSALSTERWTSVVVRESRQSEQFGTGSRILRFNLPGALQRSGLQLGQFIAIRGEWDGRQLIGYYSPITLPEECGNISILARGDKGTLSEWISDMRPGDSVEIKACKSLCIRRNPNTKQILFHGNIIRQFALIAGGTGVAPMLQIIRAALERPFIDSTESIRLIYAAEEYDELTYRSTLQSYAKMNPDKFACDFVLNRPPEGWTGGVGYIDTPSLQKTLQPPSNELLVAICGPPAMQRAVRNMLLSLGYNPGLVSTVDEEMG